MSNQPKSDRNSGPIESLFTKSIKQQRNRHECWCGKVGCIEHPKNRTASSRAAERLKQAAAKAASRERAVQNNMNRDNQKRLYVTQPRADLRQRLIAIQRSLSMIAQPQWQRHGREYQTKTISALSLNLDELVRRDPTQKRNSLVTKARYLVQRFWSNTDANSRG